METRSIPVFVVLLIFVTSEVGGSGDKNAPTSTDPYSDGSNQNGDSSLCRVVRNTKKSVLTSFTNQYNTLSGSFCDIYDHCTNVTCTAVFSRGRVNAGLLLKLCEEDPELLYWVDIPGQWDQPWNHTFPSTNMSGKVQRAEITGNPGEEVKPTKWYIKLIFSITHGRNNINQAINYITIDSTLQICQSDSQLSESTCTNTTLLNFPRLPQSQICEYPQLSQKDIGDSSQGQSEPAMLKLGDSSPTGNYSLLSSTSTRSSRNANSNPWDPEQLHRQAQERAKKFLKNGEPLKPAPGDSCDQENIFDCGPGATCLVSSDGSGKCQCLSGYHQATSGSGPCEKLPAPSPPSPSDDPSTADSLNSRSYSSAAGAIISILILVAIAAFMYFGTKYNYFSRIRHRIPVFRCWPFRRRSQSWEDNVTMVNPLGNSDDDDPLLL